MTCQTKSRRKGAEHCDKTFILEVRSTDNKCPAGEAVGKRNMAEGKIPVLSCEGSCIRGEIARLAANLVAKESRYRRACHGELLAVPDSAMHQWVVNADKVVLIDGCFLRCHGRIIEGLVGDKKLMAFDALSFYKKYTDRFDIDSVPEEERNQVAREVADWVLETLFEYDPDATSPCEEKLHERT
jgi:uncharacterized metal-binding protein